MTNHTALNTKNGIESKAKKVAQDARQEARQFAHEAQRRANVEVDRQSSQMATQFEPITNALRQTGNQLAEQDVPFAQYAHQAADQIDALQGYLQDANLNQIAADARGLAREYPEVFVGAAFTAGLMLARFFKSSEPVTVRSYPTTARRYPQPEPTTNIAPPSRPVSAPYRPPAPISNMELSDS